MSAARPMIAENTEETDDAMVGMTLAGRYRIVRLVGSGGMADVYEGLHTWTERRVAVKVLRTGRDGATDIISTPAPSTMERFLAEARAAAKTKHERVVEVLDMGRDPASGAVFMVQEYLEGEDLRRHLQRCERLDVTAALALLTPLLDVLAAAHDVGVIHRDVKPENIFLEARPDGPFARLIDFGIARIHEADRARTGVTRTGAILGTAGYMSPEQARGQSDLDARADVWAMGVVLFEALTGAAPFAGGNYNEIVSQVLTRRARRLREVSPELPIAVAEAIDKALEPDRERRHATMRDFHAALLHESPVLAPVVAARAPAARRPWRVIAALGLLAALAAGFAFRAGPAPTPTRAPAVQRPPVPISTPTVRPAPPAPAVIAEPAPSAAIPSTPALVAERVPPTNTVTAAMLRRRPIAAQTSRDAGHAPVVVPRNGAVLIPP